MNSSGFRILGMRYIEAARCLRSIFIPLKYVDISYNNNNHIKDRTVEQLSSMLLFSSDRVGDTRVRGGYEAVLFYWTFNTIRRIYMWKSLKLLQ